MLPKTPEDWLLVCTSAQLAGQVTRSFQPTTVGFLFTLLCVFGVLIMATGKMDRRPTLFALTLTILSSFWAGLFL